MIHHHPTIIQTLPDRVIVNESLIDNDRNYRGDALPIVRDTCLCVRSESEGRDPVRAESHSNQASNLDVASPVEHLQRIAQLPFGKGGSSPREEGLARLYKFVPRPKRMLARKAEDKAVHVAEASDWLNKGLGVRGRGSKRRSL